MGMGAKQPSKKTYLITKKDISVNANTTIPKNVMVSVLYILDKDIHGADYVISYDKLNLFAQVSKSKVRKLNKTERILYGYGS